MIRLRPADRRRLHTFLASEPATNIFLLSVLERGAKRSDCLTPDGVFCGHPVQGPLEAVVYASHSGLCIPFAKEAAQLERFGRGISALVRPRLLVGPREATDRLWKALNMQVTPRLYRDHRLFTLRPSDLLVSGEPAVRTALPRDLDRVVILAAEMQLEELGVDPLTVDASLFRRRISTLVSDDLLYLMQEGGELVFQASASSYCVEGAQVEAVYTPPQWRGRGYATRGLAGMSSALLARYPVVTLHVFEENERAVALYRRLGYQADTPFRLISL